MSLALIAVAMSLEGANLAVPVAECQMVRPTWCLEKSAVNIAKANDGWEISASYFDGNVVRIREGGECKSPAESSPQLESDRRILANKSHKIEEMIFLIKTSGNCRLTVLLPNTAPGERSIYKSVALTSIRVCSNEKCDGNRLASFAPAK